MRILHTSDWHLGRSFHREGMLGHQALWVDHLLEVVESEQVDLVLVSGDIYDRALPPVDAVALADETLARLAGSRARVVLTSGNHDSAIRLGAHSRLIDAAGVHLRTQPSQVGEPILIDDADGTVAVHGLPYLDPTSLLEEWALPGRSHEAALGVAMERVRATEARQPGRRTIVLAHAFVAGAQPSDSERDISVGGVSRVPASLFDGVDYVALGHLHGQQQVTDRVRYSGSPLAYSFSERGHTKGSWLIDLAGDGTIRTEFVPAPVPRPLGVLSGRLEELLTDESLETRTGHWLHVTLTDPLRPEAAMERLRQRFPYTLVLGFEPDRALPGPSRMPTLSGRSEHQVALDFVTEVRGVPASAAESDLLQDAFDACCHDRDADPVPVR